MRIGLVITAMGCGGAEGVLARLAGHIVSCGHQVTLLVLHGGPVFFALDPRVRLELHPRQEVSGMGRIRRFLHRVAWLRRRLEAHAPEVLLGFIDVANVMALLAARGSSIPVVVSERIYPPLHALPMPYPLLRRLLYPRAAAVVVQTAQTAEWARRTTAASRVLVLPNPVVPPCDDAAEPEISLPPGRWLVSMGRLEHQKGFDVLVDCFATLAAAHPDWSLLILGEGTLRPRLEQRIRELNLDGRVVLTGALQRPAAVLRRCHLFVLASRYEGFPNALCEAMSCGVPAVSFDCAAGPRDIIRHGVDGLLVPPGDGVALASALGRLMGDEAERDRLAGRAAEVVTRFDEGRVLARWEAVLVDAAAGGAPCAA